MGKDMRNEIGQWFNQQVIERTNAALQEKEHQFYLDHLQDSDTELLAYLRQCVEDLGRSPRQDEVIGGKLIAYRFGGWTHALTTAGFGPATKGPKPNGRKIFKEEYKRQHKLFKEERAACIQEKKLKNQITEYRNT